MELYSEWLKTALLFYFGIFVGMAFGFTVKNLSSPRNSRKQNQLSKME